MLLYDGSNEYTPSQDLKYLKFYKITDEWLDFFVSCRLGNGHHTISALDTLKFIESRKEYEEER